MRRRRYRTSLIVSLGLALIAQLAHAADGPKAWVPPTTKEGWAENRVELRKAVEAALGIPLLVNGSVVELPEEPKGEHSPQRLLQHPTGKTFIRETTTLKGSDGHPFRVCLLRLEKATDPQPVMIYMDEYNDSHMFNDIQVAKFQEGAASLINGRFAPFEIVDRGMAAFWIELECFDNCDPWTNPVRWPTIVANDQIALKYLLTRKDVDSTRIGVFGTGLGGTRALWLMALNDHIKVGTSVGGLTRMADLVAQRRDRMALPPWMPKIMNGLDAEVLVALCAGRQYEASVGDRDPSSPIKGVNTMFGVGKKMSGLVAGNQGFHITYQNRQDDHYGRLHWIWALEIFDKSFFPQNPKPLGHAPEPEPEVTNDFIDLAANGLAGWQVEMSQRPTTWSWNDGVISCKPGKDEYGWLRAPVEVGDFILSAEWRVPKGGNSGIFLRAKPVEWTFPPNQEYKRVVGKLALDWPSRTGLELQAQDDKGQANKYTSGSLYRHAATAANPVKPVGEWNKFTVRARGTRVEVWSNGQQILDADLKDCELTLPNPPLRGYIGLQNHGSAGDYRNIKIKKF